MNQILSLEGIVIKVLSDIMVHVELLLYKHPVLAHISGKKRQRWIRLSVGDHVKLEMASYDLDKARIVYRLS